MNIPFSLSRLLFFLTKTINDFQNRRKFENDTVQMATTEPVNQLRDKGNADKNKSTMVRK
jgi:hypothetical protein